MADRKSVKVNAISKTGDFAVSIAGVDGEIKFTDGSTKLSLSTALQLIDTLPGRFEIEKATEETKAEVKDGGPNSGVATEDGSREGNNVGDRS